MPFDRQQKQNKTETQTKMNCFLSVLLLLLPAATKHRSHSDISKICLHQRCLSNDGNDGDDGDDVDGDDVRNIKIDCNIKKSKHKIGNNVKTWFVCVDSLRKMMRLPSIWGMQSHSIFVSPKEVFCIEINKMKVNLYTPNSSLRADMLRLGGKWQMKNGLFLWIIQIFREKQEKTIVLIGIEGSGTMVTIF